MRKTEACPSDDELMAYVRGDDADSTTIKVHLAGCQRCVAACDLLADTNIAPSRAGRPTDVGGETASRFSSFGPGIETEPALMVDGATRTWDSVEFPSEAHSDESRVIRVNAPTGYKILGRLGSGGMGEVFKAIHVRLDRIVAVKMIHRGDERSLARFRVEARAVARLQHPNIVQIL